MHKSFDSLVRMVDMTDSEVADFQKMLDDFLFDNWPDNYDGLELGPTIPENSWNHDAEEWFANVQIAAKENA